MKLYLFAFVVLCCAPGVAGQEETTVASTSPPNAKCKDKHPCQEQKPKSTKPYNIDCAASEADMMTEAGKEVDQNGTLIPNKRVTVRPNYFRIVYDATSGKLGWYDPVAKKSGTDAHIILQINNLFPPVMYAHERILVTVCNAHFGADLSTTTVATAIPEPSTIRTGASVAAAAPMMNVAALDGAVASMHAEIESESTQQKTPPTPPPQPNEAVAKALAKTASAYYKDYSQLLSDVNRINCSKDGNEPCTIDSLKSVLLETQKLKSRLNKLEGTEMAQPGVFATYSSNTQQIVAQINNLSGSFDSPDIQTRLTDLNKEYTSFGKEFLDDQQTENQETLDLADRLVTPNPSRTIADMAKDDNPKNITDAVNSISQSLRELRNTASDVFEFMNAWHQSSSTSITDIVKPVPGNAVITLKIFVHDTFVPFGFASQSKPPTGTQQNAQKNTNPNPNNPSPPSNAADQYEVRRVLIEVHRTAEFNLVGGFSASHIPQRSFGLRPSTPVGSPPVILQVPYQSQNDNFQYNALTGINWYAFGRRDYFPGYSDFRHRMTHPGILVATSVTSLGNFMLGLNFEPANGVDLYVGGTIGQETHLGPGIILGVTEFSSGATTVPTRQTTTGGVFFGMGFDLSTFSSLFSKTSTPSATVSH